MNTRGRNYSFQKYSRVCYVRHRRLSALKPSRVFFFFEKSSLIRENPENVKNKKRPKNRKRISTDKSRDLCRSAPRGSPAKGSDSLTDSVLRAERGDDGVPGPAGGGFLRKGCRGDDYADGPDETDGVRAAGARGFASRCRPPSSAFRTYPKRTGRALVRKIQTERHASERHFELVL